MTKSSKSKAPGESNDVVAKPQSAMPSSDGASIPKQVNQTISAMLENSPSQKSQIGFRPTEALEEIEKETANARLVVTFAAELGALVSWKRLELSDGQEVFALCFPMTRWTTNAKGELVIKKTKP